MIAVVAALAVIVGCAYLWREGGRLIEGGLAVVDDDPASEPTDDWMALADAVQDVRDRNDFITDEIERHDFTLWTLEAGWTA